MFLYPWLFQLSPQCCLQLLCLMLLLSDSFTVSQMVPLDLPDLTWVNCSTRCDNATINTDAIGTKATTPFQKNLSSGSVLNDGDPINQSSPSVNTTSGGSVGTQKLQFSINSSSTITGTHLGSKSKSSSSSSTLQTQTAGGTNLSTASAFNQQPSPEMVSQPAVDMPFTTMASSATTAATPVKPFNEVHKVNASVIPTPTANPPSTTTTALPSSSEVPSTTTTKLPSNTTRSTPLSTKTIVVPTKIIAATTRITITEKSLAPPVGTRVPPVQTPSGTNHKEATGTRVSVVEVAREALSRQLVDRASLLAVLLFGLLFFMITVLVFVTQAYESYRRKDYTQVDYLINGMYTDSEV